jgi:Flp pilus assembly protein TadG
MPASRWIAKRLKGFLKDQSGSSYIILAFGVAMIFGVAGLAVDMGYAYMLRQRLQTAADAAALAASAQLSSSSSIVTIAREYAAKNMPTEQHGAVLAASDVQSGSWDPDSRTFTPGGAPLNAVKVTVRRSATNNNSVPTFFARVLGFGSVDVVTSAVATFATADSWDLNIVQDVTSSFSAEIGDARDGNQALLDCIQQNSSGDSQVGITAFTGEATNLAPLSGIGDGYDQLSAVVSSLDRCGRTGMPACSGTHVGAGMEAALAQFTDEGYEASSSSAGQAIVIVGDGNPNPNSSMQPYDGSCGGDCNEADLKRIAIELADAADEAGISIYTVFYDQANDDDAAAFFESLARGKGKSLRTPDSEDLPQLLTEVCASFSHRLVD